MDPGELIWQILRDAGLPDHGTFWWDKVESGWTELKPNVYWLDPDLSSIDLPVFESGTLEIELDDYELLFSGDVSMEPISPAEAARILDEIDALPTGE